MKKLILIIALLITAIIGTILVSEAFRAAPAVCAQPGYEQKYISWDDNAGPCTYPQRAISLIAFYILFPFVFLWPLTIGIIGLILFNLIKYRKLNKTSSLIILRTLIGILGLSLLALLFFTLFG